VTGRKGRKNASRCCFWRADSSLFAAFRGDLTNGWVRWVGSSGVGWGREGENEENLVRVVPAAPPKK
jgi:hypothetical protein